MNNIIEPLKAQDAVFTNSGTFSATNFMQLSPGFPLSTASSTGIKLGFNYSPLAHRMNVYGGGYRNSWHINGIGKPYQTWQEQMLFNLYKPNYAPPTLFNPGIRYLANRHNWGGYQAVFGLKERVSDFSLMNPDESTFSYAENNEPKDAVISFSYPYSTPETHKPRLIFETVELDTIYGSTAPGDMQTELATLTHNGNLGFRTSNPAARIEINGNEGLSNEKAVSIKDNLGAENFAFINTQNLGFLSINRPTNVSYNIDLLGSVRMELSSNVKFIMDNNNSQFYGPVSWFDINSNKLLSSDGNGLYVDQFKDVNSIDPYSFLVVNKQSGKLEEQFVNPNVNWSIGGNTISGGISAAFGTNATSNVDIVTKVNGKEYGRIYGNLTAKEGNLEWYSSSAIGGSILNSVFPKADNNTTLKVLARNDDRILRLGTPQPDIIPNSTILHCMTYNTITKNGIDYHHDAFKVTNTGQCFLGDFQTIGGDLYSVVSIGTHNYDMVNSTHTPVFSLTGYSDVRRNFTFDYESGALRFHDESFGFNFAGPVATWFLEMKGSIYPTTSNLYDLGGGRNWRNLYLDNDIIIGAHSRLYGGPSAEDIIWDGDILPYVGGTINNYTYNLGSASNSWNDIYAFNSTIQFSDLRLKDNVQIIDGGIETVKKLNPVTYTWKKTNQGTALHYGFISQELRQVFPNAIVVGEETDSTYLGVRYTELIPLLAKAIQEQQQIIEDQNREIEIIKNKLPADKKLVENISNTGMNKEPVLFQNTPNPFDKTTNIDYFIPEGSSQASMVIADALGKLVYSSTINKFGMGRIILTDENISQGSYFCSLYVNGKLIDTKKMLVVKN